MKTGNALATVAPNLSAELTLHDAPADSVFDGLALKIKYPFTVGAGGPITGNFAMLVAVLKAAIGSLLLEHGPTGARQMAYSAATGEDLLNVHRFLMENQIPNNIIGTVFEDGAHIAEATLRLSFIIPWLAGEKKRPGTTQVRGMKLKITEGAALAGVAECTRTDGAQVIREVEYLNRPGEDDTAPILSLSREQSPRKDLRGPDGLTIAAWIKNDVPAALGLNAFKVKIGGVVVHDVNELAPVVADFEEVHQDVGGGVITDTVSPVYAVDKGEEIDELPHGALDFEMSNQDIASVQMDVLHYPALEELQAKAETLHMANAKRTPVMMTLTERRPTAHRGAAAVAVRKAYTPSDARFTTEPGLLAVPEGSDATPSIPPHLVAAAEHGAAAVRPQGAHVAEAAARRIQKVTSLRVPGVTSTHGNGVGSLRSTIRAAFRPAFRG